MNSLSVKELAPSTCYVYAHDLAFFSLDFYSGDRASDLGRLKTKDVLRLPNNERLWFRHTFGKSLRGQRTHVFAIKPSFHPSACPIANLNLYILLADRMRVNLHNGYLFRSTDHKGRSSSNPFLSPAASNRFQKYLTTLHLHEGETVHSFRAECFITLSLLGASDKDVASHIGWKRVDTARYYMQTDTVKDPTRTSNLLTNPMLTTSTGYPLADVGAAFRARNNLDGFALFPRSLNDYIFTYIQVF